MGVEFATEQAVFVEMEDVYFSDSELVHHVRAALRLVYEGDTDSYNQLIGVLHHRERLTPDEVALLVTSLKALTGAVSCISDQHSSLVSSIFGMSLWDYGPDVMDALAELVVSLAASSGKYRDGCLKMLVSNFMPHPTFRESLKHPRGIARKEQVLCRVHSALQEIEHLVPLSSDSLGGIIIDRIRFAKKISERDLTLYVESMLRLESGDLGKAIGCTMLMGLVDKLIDLDVQIGWDDILQDDSTKGIFEMELEDVEGITLDAEQDGDELLIDSFAEKNFSIGDKLDSLMVLTFEHLESCNTGGRMIQVFETLLGSFNKTVLTTHKSKFAQFVMFYSCSLDPENCGVRFARVLSDTFMGRESPPLHRMSAVAYLASYLSRAKFLSASLVCFILERLVNWCWEYCQTQDGDINPEVHKVFYSGCQAMMYVLCFRMRSMMGIPQLKSQLLIMPIEAILKHPLDPLKVCLPSIVEEFLRQAKAAHLFTVSETFIFNDLLESELSRAFGGLERLDMFFPFDPYLLKKSDRFIRPNFIYWSMVTTTYDNEDDSTDDDDAPSPRVGNGENIADYDGMASSFEDNDVDLDEFDYSLNKMSITPRNSSLKYSFGGEFGGPMQMPSRIRPSTSPESL